MAIHRKDAEHMHGLGVCIKSYLPVARDFPTRIPDRDDQPYPLDLFLTLALLFLILLWENLTTMVVSVDVKLVVKST